MPRAAPPASPCAAIPADALTPDRIARMRASDWSVLFVLCRHADARWSCRAGFRQIMLETGLTSSRVQRAVQHLQDLRIITTERFGAGRGRRYTIQTNAYR